MPAAFVCIISFNKKKIDLWIKDLLNFAEEETEHPNNFTKII